MLTPKYPAIKETPNKVENQFEDIYFVQEQLLQETETLVRRCFDPSKADLINFDAFQALCFLIVADQQIDLGNVELENCLDLLSVHPVVLEDTVRVLKKIYHVPKNTDLLTFLRYIGPILLERKESLDDE